MVLKIASIHDPEKMSRKVMLILVCADAVDNVNCLQGPVFVLGDWNRMLGIVKSPTLCQMLREINNVN